MGCNRGFILNERKLNYRSLAFVSLESGAWWVGGWGFKAELLVSKIGSTGKLGEQANK